MKGIKRLLMVGLVSLGALCFAACSGSDDDTDDHTDSTDSTGSTDSTDSTDVGTFAGGTFALKTTGAVDNCLDKALEEVFLPGGQPRDLPDNEVPAEADLPADLTIKLNAPFAEMPVKVTSAGAGKMKFGDGAQTGVLLDDAQWQGCTVDMDIAADVTLNSDTQIAVSATLTLKNFTGDNCPVVDKDPCTVVLDIAGTKK